MNTTVYIILFIILFHIGLVISVVARRNYLQKELRIIGNVVLATYEKTKTDDHGDSCIYVYQYEVDEKKYRFQSTHYYGDSIELLWNRSPRYATEEENIGIQSTILIGYFVVLPILLIMATVLYYHL